MSGLESGPNPFGNTNEQQMEFQNTSQEESTEYLENDALEVYQWSELGKDDWESDDDGKVTQVRIPPQSGEFYSLSEPVNVSEMQRAYVSVREEEEGQNVVEVKDTEETFENMRDLGEELENLRERKEYPNLSRQEEAAVDSQIHNRENEMRDGIQEAVNAYGGDLYEVDKNEDEVEYERFDQGESVIFQVQMYNDTYYISVPQQQADKYEQRTLAQNKFGVIESSSGKIKIWPKHTETGYYIKNDRTAEWLQEHLKGNAEPYIEDRTAQEAETEQATEGEQKQAESLEEAEDEERNELLEQKSPETRQALEEFLQFVSENQNILASAQDKEDLTDYIYDNFYAYRNELSEEQLEGLKQQHDQELKHMITELQNNEVSYVENHKGFTFAVLNEGLNEDEPEGRLYMNVSPDSMYQQFAVIANALNQGEINGQMKIDNDKSEGSYTRPDKVVVYFNAEQSETMLSLVEQLQHKENISFEANLPQFTTSIQEGVGFGEEPPDGSSFGDIRSQILADIYTYAQNENQSLDQWTEGLDWKLQELCDYYQVDPNDMAFNSASGDGEHPFEAIREYVTQNEETTAEPSESTDEEASAAAESTSESDIVERSGDLTFSEQTGYVSRVSTETYQTEGGEQNEMYRRSLDPETIDVHAERVKQNDQETGGGISEQDTDAERSGDSISSEQTLTDPAVEHVENLKKRDPAVDHVENLENKNKETVLQLTPEQSEQFTKQLKQRIEKEEENLDRLAEELADVEEQYEGLSKIWNKIGLGASQENKQDIQRKYQEKQEEYQNKKEEVIHLKTLLETREEIGDWFSEEQQRYQELKSQEKEQKKSRLEKMGERFLNWYSNQKWYTKAAASVGVVGASSVLGGVIGGAVATAGALGLRTAGSASMGKTGFEIARQKLENGKLNEELDGLEQMSDEQISQFSEEYTSDKLATLDGYAALNGGQVPDQYQNVYASLQKHYGELLADQSNVQQQKERWAWEQNQPISQSVNIDSTKHSLDLRSGEYEQGKEEFKHERTVAKRWGYGTAAVGFGAGSVLGWTVDAGFWDGSSADASNSPEDINIKVNEPIIEQPDNPADSTQGQTGTSEGGSDNSTPENQPNNGNEGENTEDQNHKQSNNNEYGLEFNSYENEDPYTEPSQNTSQPENGGHPSSEAPSVPETNPIPEVKLDQGSTIWEEIEGVLEQQGLDSGNARVQELVNSYLTSEGGAEDLYERAQEIPAGRDKLQELLGSGATADEVHTDLTLEQKYELARYLSPGELEHLNDVLQEELNMTPEYSTQDVPPTEPSTETPDNQPSSGAEQQSSEPNSEIAPEENQTVKEGEEQGTKSDQESTPSQDSSSGQTEEEVQTTEQTQESGSEQIDGEQSSQEQATLKNFESQVQNLKKEVEDLSENDLRIQREGKILNMSESVLQDIFSIHEMPPSSDLNLPQEVDKIYSSMPKEALNQFFDTDAGKEWLYEQLEENSSLLDTYNIENAEQLPQKLSENGKKYGILWKHPEVFPKGEKVMEFKEFLLNSDFLQNKLEKLQEATSSAANNTSK